MRPAALAALLALCIPLAPRAVAATVPAPAAAQGAAPRKPPPQPPRPAMIEVIRASYGGRNDLTPCDVSASLKTACNDRFSCAIPVSDSLCTTAAAPPMLIPILQVTYRCSDAENTRVRTAEKPFMLRLSCTPLRH